MFPKGNSYFKNRATSGPAKRIPTPEAFWDLFLAYVKYVDDNPWTKTDYRGKDAEPVVLEFKAPYSFNGFDNYVFGIGLLSNLEDYRYNTGGAYGDFKEVVARVMKCIYDQKITGATVGFFNPSIISKELGLVEKQEVQQTSTIINLGTGVDPEAPVASGELPVVEPIQDFTEEDMIDDMLL